MQDIEYKIMERMNKDVFINPESVFLTNILR